ncbi:MAG TPA: ATP-binding cassette domain-containing protein [Candidatus Saccharimonadales bacterium]|nr:ATP-binding cassette domain-containing protein [Candidatus Saccharimonadales bacterium]
MSSERQPAIILKDVVKNFDEVIAVDHINLTIPTGQIFAFLGPNGAGKSTTIKMLTTLLRPTSGELELAGHNVISDQIGARRSFGVVFQDPSLDDDLTAYENMEFHAVLYGMSRRKIRPRIEELLELVDLKERQASQVKTFSGGMKRRLEIARGLLHQPKILFLDEPTLGLDTQTRRLLWSYVEKLNKETGMTIFFTTHYLEEAEVVAERIAIIDHGKIVALGSTKELCKQTHTTSLENAYLKLTGTAIRDETVSASDSFRARVGARRRQ